MTVLRTAVAALLLVLGLGACADPNFIGVQDYGYIVGNVVDQNGKPIANAFVTSTGTTATSYTGTNGSFTVQNVAIGEQTVNVTANGFQPLATPVTVVVAKGQGVSAGNITLQSALPAQ